MVSPYLSIICMGNLEPKAASDSIQRKIFLQKEGSVCVVLWIGGLIRVYVN